MTFAAGPTAQSRGRIVVGVDGSSGSRAALQWAIAEAQMREVPLHAVMCAPTDPGGRVDDLAGSSSDTDPSGLRVLLDEAVAASGAVGVEVAGSVMYGNPGQVLIAAAMGADLLVVGSRGHGRVVGTLIGSVSQLLVTQAPCTVIVVPDAQQQQRRQAAAALPSGTRYDGSALPTQAETWAAMRPGI
jgi:nucleotide-binding universal stress UspA family protein